MSKELLHKKLMKLWVEGGQRLQYAIEDNLHCNKEVPVTECPHCATLNLFNTLMAEIHTCALMAEPDQ